MDKRLLTHFALAFITASTAVLLSIAQSTCSVIHKETGDENHTFEQEAEEYFEI